MDGDGELLLLLQLELLRRALLVLLLLRGIAPPHHHRVSGSRPHVDMPVGRLVACRQHRQVMLQLRFISFELAHTF